MVAFDRSLYKKQNSPREFVEKETITKNNCSTIRGKFDMLSSNIFFIFLMGILISNVMSFKMSIVSNIKDGTGTVIPPLTGLAGSGLTQLGYWREFKTENLKIWHAYSGAFSTGNNIVLYSPDNKYLAGTKRSPADRIQNSLISKEMIAVATDMLYVIITEAALNEGYITLTTPTQLMTLGTTGLGGCQIEDESTFVYCASNIATVPWTKTDYVTPGPIMQNIIASTKYNRDVYIVKSNYVLSVGIHQTYAGLVDKSTLLLTFSLADSLIIIAILDNLNDEYIFGTYLASHTSFFKGFIDISKISGTTMTVVSIPSTPTGTIFNGHVNAGNFQYVISMTVSSSNIYIYRKHDLQIEKADINLTQHLDAWFYVIFGLMTSDTEFVWGAPYSLGNSINFYTFEDIWTGGYISGICKGCKTGYYLNSLSTNNNCITSGEVPEASGIDTNTGIVVPCEENWKLWALDYTKCTQWVSLSTVYFDAVGQKWYLDSEIPNRLGKNVPIQQLKSCRDPYWSIWDQNFNICIFWDNLYGLSEDTGSWISWNTEGYGRNQAFYTNMKACTDVNWKYCSNDYTIWTEWKTIGYRVSAGRWYSETSTPGIGRDPSNPLVLTTCSVLNCLNWFQVYSIWSKWAATYILKYGTNTWVLSSVQIPSYGTILFNPFILMPCKQQNCLDCAQDYEIWVKCISPYSLLADGTWSIESGYYYTLDVKNNTQNNPESGVFLSFMLTITNRTISGDIIDCDTSDLNRKLLDSINSKKSTMKIMVTKTDDKPVYSIDSLKILKTKKFVLLNVENGFSLKSAKTNYKLIFETQTITINLGNPSPQRLLASADIISFQMSRTEFPFYNKVSSDDISKYQSVGNIANIMCGSFINSEVASIFVNLVTLCEPTGALITFVQSLKLVSKLKYLNTNQGIYISSVLGQVDDSTKYDSKQTKEVQGRNVQNYRMKLSEDKVPLEIHIILIIKITAYFTLWGFKFLHYTTLKPALGNESPIYNMVSYWMLRAQFFVFLVVFMDFLFYGTRSMYQSRNLQAAKIVGYVAVQLVAIDIVMFLAYTLDKTLWAIRYSVSCVVYQKKSVSLLRNEDRKSYWTGKCLDESMTASRLTSNTKSNSRQDEGNDYLIFLPSLGMRITRIAYLDRFLRMAWVIQICRLAIYQIAIVGGQVWPKLALCVCFAMELSLFIKNLISFFSIDSDGEKGLMFTSILSNASLGGLLAIFLFFLSVSDPDESIIIHIVGVCWILVYIACEYIRLYKTISLWMGYNKQYSNTNKSQIAQAKIMAVWGGSGRVSWTWSDEREAIMANRHLKEQNSSKANLKKERSIELLLRNRQPLSSLNAKQATDNPYKSSPRPEPSQKSSIISQNEDPYKDKPKDVLIDDSNLDKQLNSLRRGPSMLGVKKKTIMQTDFYQKMADKVQSLNVIPPNADLFQNINDPNEQNSANDFDLAFEENEFESFHNEQSPSNDYTSLNQNDPSQDFKLDDLEYDESILGSPAKKNQKFNSKKFPANEIPVNGQDQQYKTPRALNNNLGNNQNNSQNFPNKEQSHNTGQKIESEKHWKADEQRDTNYINGRTLQPQKTQFYQNNFDDDFDEDGEEGPVKQKYISPTQNRLPINQNNLGRINSNVGYPRNNNNPNGRPFNTQLRQANPSIQGNNQPPYQQISSQLPPTQIQRPSLQVNSVMRTPARNFTQNPNIGNVQNSNSQQYQSPPVYQQFDNNYQQNSIGENEEMDDGQPRKYLQKSSTVLLPQNKKDIQETPVLLDAIASNLKKQNNFKVKMRELGHRMKTINLGSNSQRSNQDSFNAIDNAPSNR